MCLPTHLTVSICACLKIIQIVSCWLRATFPSIVIVARITTFRVCYILSVTLAAVPVGILGISPLWNIVSCALQVIDMEGFVILNVRRTLLLLNRYFMRREAGPSRPMSRHFSAPALTLNGTKNWATALNKHYLPVLSHKPYFSVHFLMSQFFSFISFFLITCIQSQTA